MWKRVFIEKFVRKPKDQRSTTDFRIWNDQLPVVSWDSLAKNRDGFTLLVAMAYTKEADKSGMILTGKIAGTPSEMEIITAFNNPTPNTFELAVSFVPKQKTVISQYFAHTALHFNLKPIPPHHANEYRAEGDFYATVSVIYALLDQGWTPRYVATKRNLHNYVDLFPSEFWK